MTSDISRSFKSFEGTSWKLSTLEYSEYFSNPSEDSLGARLNAFLSYLVTSVDWCMDRFTDSLLSLVGGCSH